MATESVPFINHPIRELVPSYFFPKHKFSQPLLIISISIMVIDPKNLVYDLFIITLIPLKYFYQVPLNLRL